MNFITFRLKTWHNMYIIKYVLYHTKTTQVEQKINI